MDQLTEKEALEQLTITELNNNDLPSRYMQLNGHKATIDELLEYFK